LSGEASFRAALDAFWRRQGKPIPEINVTRAVPIDAYALWCEVHAWGGANAVRRPSPPLRAHAGQRPPLLPMPPLLAAAAAVRRRRSRRGRRGRRRRRALNTGRSARTASCGRTSRAASARRGTCRSSRAAC
jgi:hypothetical protein